ncbi:TPA: hypothetical protein ACQZPA_005163 [Klebsiella quasipneumoniae subsp. similipneumoniae]
MLQNEQKLAAVLGITPGELRESLQDIGLAVVFQAARDLHMLEVASAGGDMIVSDEVPARLVKQAFESMFLNSD